MFWCKLVICEIKIRIFLHVQIMLCLIERANKIKTKLKHKAQLALEKSGREICLKLVFL